MYDAFSPHAQLKSPHIAFQTPPLPLCHRHSQKSQPYSQHPHKKWKWMYSPPVVGAERECGRGERDMASVQEGCESLRLTNITTHPEYFMKHVPHAAAMLSCAAWCLFFVSKTFSPWVVFYNHLSHQWAATSSQSGESFLFYSIFFWGVWECVKCECDRMCLCRLCDSSEATERSLSVCMRVCGLALSTGPKLRLIPPTATPVSTPDTTNQPFWMQARGSSALSSPFLHLNHWRWNNKAINMQSRFVWCTSGCYFLWIMPNLTKVQTVGRPQHPPALPPERK